MVLLLSAPLWAAPFQPQTDLRRLVLGSQAGILKIKNSPYFRCLDTRDLAPWTDTARQGLFQTLGISASELAEVGRQVITGYAREPHAQAVALLGAIGSQPGVENRGLQAFAAEVMERDREVSVRRQALLALALMQGAEPSTVDQVLAFYEKSDNLWETFPVQQFFEYHAAQIRGLPDYARIRERVAAVRSLYTPAILGYLETSS